MKHATLILFIISYLGLFSQKDTTLSVYFGARWELTKGLYENHFNKISGNAIKKLDGFNKKYPENGIGLDFTLPYHPDFKTSKKKLRPYFIFSYSKYFKRGGTYNDLSNQFEIDAFRTGVIGGTNYSIGLSKLVSFRINLNIGVYNTLFNYSENSYKTRQNFLQPGFGGGLTMFINLPLFKKPVPLSFNLLKVGTNKVSANISIPVLIIPLYNKN